MVYKSNFGGSMGKHGWFFFGAVAVLVSLFSLNVHASQEPESVPGEYVVKLRAQVGMFSAGAMAHEMGGEIIDR